MIKDFKVSADDIVCITKFTSKNNFIFDLLAMLNSRLEEQQLILNLFWPQTPPPNEIYSGFLKTRKLQQLVQFRHIDEIFFIWSHHKDKEPKKFYNSYNLNRK